MCKYRNSDFRSQTHCLSCHSRIHNRLAVFADRNRTVFVQIFKICDKFSVLSRRNCRNRKHMDVCYFLCLVNHILHHFHAVYNRLGIRHDTNGCKSASCRCSGSGTDCFLMFKSRLPEMYMQVNQSRHDIKTFCLNYIFRIGTDMFCNLFNNTVFHKNIPDAVCAACWI